MRKLMLALAFVGFTATAFAQETTVPVSKYSVSTNSFWSNWFVTVGGDFNAMYTSQEDCCNKNPFSVDRGTFGFDVAVGKWFTPVIGLRTKFQGIWAKQVNTRDDHHSYKNFNVHEDVMFNLHNLFGGYKADRVWNIIPYFGLGYAHNLDSHNGEFSYNFGLLNNFRINNRLGIYFDVYTAWMEGNFDGATPDAWNKHGKYTARHWDKMVGASLGLTINLGKTTWEKTPDVAALMAMNKEQVDALNASLKDQQDENARLRDLLANQKPVEKVVEGLQGDEKTGARIVLRALEAPMKQIALNAGLEGAVIVNSVKEKEGNIGFNALTEEYVDMFEEGIIDPAKVTRSALQNATSVASTFLTTEAVVAEFPDKNAPAMPAGGGMGGYM